MRHYAPEHIRNVAVVAHGGAGKTTLVEAMLFTANVTTRMGRVEDGNTTSDFDPDEARRHMSISSAVAPLEWRDTKINLIDTPGYADFVGEMHSALRVAESALIVVDASSPVEVGTEQAWKLATEQGIARMIYVNKLSRENADFEGTISTLRARFGKSVVAVQFPIGKEKGFCGVVDLLREQAHTLPADGSATEVIGEVPADLRETVDEYRRQLIEVIAEQDEDLMVRYLDDDPIALEELYPVLRRAVLKGNITPMFCGSATVNIGTHLLLDDIVEMAPWAAQDGGLEEKPLQALVFKTIADPHVGRVSLFRVYQGKVSANSHVQNTSQDQGERIGQVFYVRGKDHVSADFIGAGDIGAVAKLTSTQTGDTLAADGATEQLAGIAFPRASYAVAVKPQTKADLDKLGQSLHRLVEEDPSLQLGRDGTTGESILSGMGESHVQIALERMSRRFGVSVTTDLPRVAYRETISSKVSAEYKHKKQTGGAGQYGHVFLELEPLPDGEFEFGDRVVGGSV
ncbi:MAG TPA: elongation factor G, partial [Thermomicrobiales bacterium]|nr:elongation factor G [Thermomicrobiales bacterium]